MIVWGGNQQHGRFANGGTLQSSTDSWLTVSLGSAPAIRHSHIAVWTGTQMIVWGGINGQGQLRSGGR